MIEPLNVINITNERTAPTRKSTSFSFRKDTNSCNMHVNKDIEAKAICKIKTGVTKKVQRRQKVNKFN